MSGRVDVVMRTKNCDWVVDRALEGLFSQRNRDFDLFVVDSGSTDRTLEIVRRYPHRLVEIAASDYYPGRVLNMAMERTTSPIVVFQNSDTVPLEPRALDWLLEPFADPLVRATFARQLPRPDAHTWVREEYARTFPAQGNPPTGMLYSLPFAAMRRSAWEEHPFYSDAWGSEDTEWGHREAALGYPPRYVPQAIVMHSHNYSLQQLYGRRFIEGEADAFIYGGTARLPRLALRAARALGRDLAALVQARDLVGIALAPARCAVYQWGYYQGHRHGEKRIAENDGDASFGQRVVLERHESKA